VQLAASGLAAEARHKLPLELRKSRAPRTLLEPRTMLLGPHTKSLEPRTMLLGPHTKPRELRTWLALTPP